MHWSSWLRVRVSRLIRWSISNRIRRLRDEAEAAIDVKDDMSDLTELVEIVRSITR